MDITLVLLGFIGVLSLALGGVYLGRKKLVISLRYPMTFLMIWLFIWAVVDPFWTSRELLILGVFYLLLLVISLIMVKGRYEVTNIRRESLGLEIKGLLDEKEIIYEVDDKFLMLTDYDNKAIKYRGFGDSSQINFRGIMKLPIYNDLKAEFISRVAVNQEKTFPWTAALLIVAGLAAIIFVVVQWN